MSNGQDAQWSRMTLRAHTNAWLHRHEDLDMASRTRNGPGDWNNPRDMENIPRVVKRDAFCFCFTPALLERSDIREDDRYFLPPRHSTSLPPRYTHSSRLLATRRWHAWPYGMQLLLARRARVRDLTGSPDVVLTTPGTKGMAFVLSFSTASDGASATYPNGASDSDAWARVPEIGIHPERVSRGGRGKGLAARGVRRGQRPLAIGTPPLAGRGLSMPVLSGTRGPQNAARPRSATDTIGCPRLIQSFTRGTRRWRDGVVVRPRRPGHDSALARCAWEKTLAGGYASFAEREGGPRWGPQGYGL
ncbi:hypothetical protein GGF50DRAFT_98171, partial [Schizophyllum commune]